MAVVRQRTKKVNATTKRPPPKIGWGIKPYPLQQEVVDAIEGVTPTPKGKKYTFFLAIFGRQSGKSWLGKYMVLEKAINQHKHCMWVSLTVKAAQLHWNEILEWLDNSGYDGVLRMNEQAKEIYFEGGGWLIVRTVQEPENLRGAGLDFMVLDEAAHYPKGEYVWYSILGPMITATNGQVLFATTPHGQNWIYKLYNKGNKGNSEFYKSWTIPSWEAPYQNPELLAEYKQDMPSYQWREEYGAEFLADSGGVFPGYSEAAVVKMGDFSEEDLVDFRVSAADFGFAKDFSTYTMVEILKNGLVRQVYGKRWSEPGTIQTVHNLLELCRMHRPRYLFMENNGVGATMFRLIKELAKGKDIALAEEFAKRVNNRDGGHTSYSGFQVGETKIVGIVMDNPTKREMVEGTAAAIEYGRMQLLRNDGDANDYGVTQASEASTMQREKTKNEQTVTYNAAEGAHDDCISSLVMCYKGIPPRQKIMFTPEKDLHKVTKQKSIFRGSGKSFKRAMGYAKRN